MRYNIGYKKLEDLFMIFEVPDDQINYITKEEALIKLAEVREQIIKEVNHQYLKSLKSLMDTK